MNMPSSSPSPSTMNNPPQDPAPLTGTLPVANKAPVPQPPLPPPARPPVIAPAIILSPHPAIPHQHHAIPPPPARPPVIAPAIPPHPATPHQHPTIPPPPARPPAIAPAVPPHPARLHPYPATAIPPPPARPPAANPYPMTAIGTGPQNYPFPQLYGYAGLAASGPWSFHEHRLFEQGCIMYGWGNWKKVQEAIPGRTKDQCKSHGQKFLKHHPGEKDRLISEHRKLLTLQGGKFPPSPKGKSKDKKPAVSTNKSSAKPSRKRAIKRVDSKPVKKNSDIVSGVAPVMNVTVPQNAPATQNKEAGESKKESPSKEGENSLDKKFSSDSIDVVCNDIYKRKLKGQVEKDPSSVKDIAESNTVDAEQRLMVPLPPVATEAAAGSSEKNKLGETKLGGLIEAAASLEHIKQGGTKPGELNEVAAAPLGDKPGGTKSGEQEDGPLEV